MFTERGLSKGISIQGKGEEKRINFFFFFSTKGETEGRYGNRMLFDIVLLLLSIHAYVSVPFAKGEKERHFRRFGKKYLICRKQVSLKVIKRLRRNFVSCYLVSSFRSREKLYQIRNYFIYFRYETR